MVSMTIFNLSYQVTWGMYTWNEIRKKFKNMYRSLTIICKIHKIKISLIWQSMTGTYILISLVVFISTDLKITWCHFLSEIWAANLPRMLQIATLIRFMEGSSKVQRQFITNRAQRYLSNSTACSILSLHSVSKLFFCSCKHNLNLHGLSKQDKTQEQRNGSHCIFLAFFTNYKNNVQCEDHVHQDRISNSTIHQMFIKSIKWVLYKGYTANVSFIYIYIYIFFFFSTFIIQFQ